MSDYITTHSGIHFYPTEPEPEKFRIEDIAHALSLICRGNGQLKVFLSVGKHCIFCAREAEARGYSTRVKLACLLHDACESYLSDVPTPFKRQMPSYEELENKMLDMIYEKYLGSPLTRDEQRKVNEIDHDLLYYDLLELLNEPSDRPAPEMKAAFSYEVLPFEQVEQTYLELFRRYSSELSAHHQ